MLKWPGAHVSHRLTMMPPGACSIVPFCVGKWPLKPQSPQVAADTGQILVQQTARLEQ